MEGSPNSQAKVNNSVYDMPLIDNHISILYIQFILHTNTHILYYPIQKYFLGFPGGSVVGSLPANEGDMGSSPGPGGSCKPRSK